MPSGKLSQRRSWYAREDMGGKHRLLIARRNHAGWLRRAARITIVPGSDTAGTGCGRCDCPWRVQSMMQRRTRKSMPWTRHEAHVRAPSIQHWGRRAGS
jgi:hypothetical protein